MPGSKVRRKPAGGRPLAGPAAAVTTQLDLPGITFPADLLGPEAPDITEVRVDVVFRRSEPDPAFRLPLRLVRRIAGAARVDLWGTALDGILEVHLTGAPDGAWRMQSHTSEAGLDGRQTLRLLDLLDALESARDVGLAPTGEHPSTWGTVGTAQATAPLVGLRQTVKEHAAIEDRLGVSVPVPAEYTPSARRDTAQTWSLLRGETVTSTWSDARIDLVPGEPSELGEDIFTVGSTVKAEVEQEWIWMIGTREIPVGSVTAEYSSARISEVGSGGPGSGGAFVTFLPGDNDTVSYRLVEVATGPDGGVDQRWFWSPDRQAREAEVDRFVEADEVTTHKDSTAFLSHLGTVAGDVG